jgi:hypothetical protein
LINLGSSPPSPVTAIDQRRQFMHCPEARSASAISTAGLAAISAASIALLCRHVLRSFR